MPNEDEQFIEERRTYFTDLLAQTLLTYDVPILSSKKYGVTVNTNTPRPTTISITPAKNTVNGKAYYKFRVVCRYTSQLSFSILATDFRAKEVFETIVCKLKTAKVIVNDPRSL